MNTSPSDVKSFFADNARSSDFLIEPGLVLLRNYCSDAQCQEFARMAQEWGGKYEDFDSEDGFYTTCPKTGNRVLNTGEAGRGRIYDAASQFPSFVTDTCVQALAAAQEMDRAMPDMTCTHVLLLSLIHI